MSGFPSFANPFGGVEIRETMTAVEKVEDWSRVRSPSRAARRLKRGFRQNIVTRYKPAAFNINGVIFAHPEIVRTLADATKRRSP